MFKFRFAYKIHLLEECRNFCLLHFKKLDWFNKLSQEDKSHKAMIAKNKYKRYTKYTSGHMRDQLIKVHEAYQSLRLELSCYLRYRIAVVGRSTRESLIVILPELCSKEVMDLTEKRVQHWTRDMPWWTQV